MQELRFDDLRFAVSTGNDQVWLHRGSAAMSCVFSSTLWRRHLRRPDRSLFWRPTCSASAPPPTPIHAGTHDLEPGLHAGHHRAPGPAVLSVDVLQLHAIEAGRTGDMRFELDLNATLPQAVGYPACAPATLGISIAKSRWEEQIAALGPSSAFEMAVPFPLADEPRAEVGRTLREAQRLITVGEIRASILEMRRALEWIQQNAAWDNPGTKKLAEQCSQSERWWRIQAALYSQTSGAMHNDAITRDFQYSRAEAETILAMTSALLRNVS